MILTGHPCSGKSAIALKIRERALQRHPSLIHSVVIINEASACPDNSIAACYATPLAEKKTRAALKSAFDRAVAASDKNRTLVVLDSSNYIKGFRYELFCISKEKETSHCVVWCLNDRDTIEQWNDERRASSSATYNTELLDSLIRRYEPPDERNRWDRPLYNIDLRPAAARSASHLAGEALNQSVYNMHNLSGAIGSSSNISERITTAAKDESNSSAARRTAASSTFKRAPAFKRPASASQSAGTPIATSKPTARSIPLTAEALSSLAVAAGSNAPHTETSGPAAFADGSAAASSGQQHATTQAKDFTKTEPQLKSMEEQIDEILDSFLSNDHRLREGASTRQHVATDANVLNRVDSLTQQVLTSIQAAQDQNPCATGRLAVVFQGTTLFLDYRRRISITELRRIRRQYIQWVGTNPPEDASEVGVAKSFLAYIETTQ